MCHRLTAHGGGGGDCNTTLDNLGAAAWFAALGWQGLGMEPTSWGTQSTRALRIDVCVGNKAACDRCVSFSAEWTRGWPTRARQSLQVEMGPLPRFHGVVLSDSLAPETEPGREALAKAEAEALQNGQGP